MILGRKGRYCAVFTREFNQAPIRASTRGVGIVFDLVDANVARDKKNLERIIQVNLLWERLQDLTRYPTLAPSQ